MDCAGLAGSKDEAAHSERPRCLPIVVQRIFVWHGARLVKMRELRAKECNFGGIFKIPMARYGWVRSRTICGEELMSSSGIERSRCIPLIWLGQYLRQEQASCDPISQSLRGDVKSFAVSSCALLSVECEFRFQFQHHSHGYQESCKPIRLKPEGSEASYAAIG